MGNSINFRLNALIQKSATPACMASLANLRLKHLELEIFSSLLHEKLFWGAGMDPLSCIALERINQIHWAEDPKK